MNKWWTFLVGLAAGLVLRQISKGEAWNQVGDRTISGGMFDCVQEPVRLKKTPIGARFYIKL